MQNIFNRLAMVCILALTLNVTSSAQSAMPDQHFWGDFYGKINGRDIALSVYRKSADSLTGNYRFTNDPGNVFLLDGTVKNNRYALTGQNGEFIFEHQFDKANKADKFEGSFTGTGGKQTPVALSMRSMVYGDENNRYGELFGTTVAVDSFAAKIKTAFINADKEWLASRCQYPVNVFGLSGKKLTVIKNKEEFLTKFAGMFKKEYRDKFKKIACYNMFCQHTGVLMGKGEVTINQTSNSEKDNYTYCITAITVFM